MQQAWATPEAVSAAIADIRLRSSSPIVAYARSEGACESLLQAGADCVLNTPLDSEQLKAELRSLLDLNELVQTEPEDRWSGLSSLLRTLQRGKSAD
jgi:hypothetical protein